MTKTIQLLLGLIGTLLFTVGLLIGQQVKRSKFDKYLRPATVSEMEMALIQANLDVIQDSVHPSTQGIELPKIYYDLACSCVAATVIVHSDLMNESIDNVRNKLTAEAVFARTNAKEWVPELTESDFRMTFRALKTTPSIRYETVAEYTNGNLTFK